ncbi:hypothetical protein NP493_71g02032 [Ridgeia piscesae]|uniref:ATP-dependent RNA helicase n=1 Tax=Ridgeia piscesae TaxID=27915 RepID=A0AAD9UIM8_RIDPI|nr:hypothetical protein NP493_71g02032 [Ridgeia piscesae]
MDRKRQRSNPNRKNVDKKTVWKKKDSKIEAVDQEIEQLKAKYNEIDVASVQTFSSFPLSQKTQQGLKAAHFEKPTEIQRQSIGLALRELDILGAAKTGSGKTLAFLIPILERLYNLKWSHLDGLGALIISPTRELAYQIFEMLKTVGKFHDFSAGLVIGGKPLREEAERINRTNVVILLDEADRILDMGFAQTMNAIVENLPTERQTLLFSATQTNAGTTRRHDTTQAHRLLPTSSVVNRMPSSSPPDLAARGLDFPAVDWVVQLDCPEDANTYIHRVGRTARCEKNGEALLVLLASEEDAMVEQLKTKKIPIEKIRVNPKKKWSIQPKLQSMCAADVQLKEFAQRAVVSYVKAVFLMKNKQVFDVTKLDVDKYANSMGLAVTPRLRFLQKYQKQQSLKRDTARDAPNRDTNPPHTSLLPAGSEEEETGSEDEEDLPQPPCRQQEAFGFDVEDDLDDILKVKAKTTVSSSDEDMEEDHKNVAVMFPQVKPSAKSKKLLTKFALAKKLAKKNIQVNTKVVFDDEGKEVADVHKKPQATSSEDTYEAGIDIEQVKKNMAEEDKFDKQLYRDKIKLKHKPLAVLDVDDADRCNIDDLPDPDKYYGPAASDDDNGSSDDDESSDHADRQKKTCQTVKAMRRVILRKRRMTARETVMTMTDRLRKEENGQQMKDWVWIRFLEMTRTWP